MMTHRRAPKEFVAGDDRDPIEARSYPRTRTRVKRADDALALFFLMILLGLTMVDYALRAWAGALPAALQ